MRTTDELRALVDAYLDHLALTPELATLEAPIRYALGGGGKRVRPVLCLATGEAAGAAAEALLPAAAALELVHTFSLVHDDLPALDDDATRRGRETLHVRFDEAQAILAGDALLVEAFRLALLYADGRIARELASATAAMIGGQQLDVTGAGNDLGTLYRLKTGALFGGAVACALWVADVPERDQSPWRAFAEDVGLLFQLVDDLLDGDGYVERVGAGETRRLAEEAAARAQGRLGAVPADTSVLASLVSGLAARTS